MHLQSFLARSNYSYKNGIQAIFESRSVNNRDNTINVWTDRYRKQITNIHFTIYYLDPANQHIAATVDKQAVLLRFLKRYIKRTDNNFRNSRRQYFYLKLRSKS